MPTITPAVGSEVTSGTTPSLVINPDGLASGSARQSTVITLTGLGGQTGVPDDVLICGLFKTVTGTLSTPAVINIWLGVPATGSRYADGLTGTDGAFTMLATPGMKLLTQVVIDTAGTAKDLMETSVYGVLGFVPDKLIVVVENKTGLALAGTAGQEVQNLVTIRPQQYTSQ